MSKMDERGFTLVEIMITLAIMVVLFIIMVPQVESAIMKSRESGIRTDFHDFRSAAETVLREQQHRSLSKEALNGTLDPSHHLVGEDNPYATTSLNPWDNPYTSVLQSGKIVFSSSGKDGTEDAYVLASYYHHGKVASCTSGFPSGNLDLHWNDIPPGFNCGDDIQPSAVEPPSETLATPINFQATGITDSRVELSWDSVSGATFYILKRNGTTIYEGGNTSFHDITLSPGTTYSYTVIARNGSETSGAATLSVTTPSTPPPPLEDGSLEHPFIIQNCLDLQNVNHDLFAHYALGNDIDCSVSASWDGGKGFLPIGSNAPHQTFSGSLDGRGYAIHNLAIQRGNERRVGMFAIFESGFIRDLHLRNASVEGSEEVGILTGRVVDAQVENVSVTGTVHGNIRVGGMFGYIDSSEVHESYVDANVSGDRYLGGFTGVNDKGTVKDSYVRGTVTGTNFGRGGFVSQNSAYATLEHVYTAASISTNSGTYTGGLVGRLLNSTVTSSYYDRERAGFSDVGKGEPKLTTDMKQMSTYADWDFDNVWNINPSINDGYPYLRNNPPD